MSMQLAIHFYLQSPSPLVPLLTTGFMLEANVKSGTETSEPDIGKMQVLGDLVGASVLRALNLE